MAVAVRFGLDIDFQSLPVAGVAAGKFNREVEQGSGLGAISGWGLGVLTCFHRGVYYIPMGESNSNIETQEFEI